METHFEPSSNREAITEASQPVALGAGMLHAIVSRLSDLPVGPIRELLTTTDEVEQTSLLEAIKTLHGHLFSTADATPPLLEGTSLHERIGSRLLQPEGGNLGGATAQLRKLRVIDAGHLRLETGKQSITRFPIDDMFHNPDIMLGKDSVAIHPGIAAYFLKAVVGAESYPKRKLVDLVDDARLAELIAYACVINKYHRSVGVNMTNNDLQAARLLQHISGMNDREIAESEGGQTRDTSHIRRSRRTMIRNLQSYAGFILYQIQAMAADPELHLVVEDPIYGLRMTSETTDALEATARPIEHLTPTRMIELAMRRCIANVLVDNPNTDTDELVNNLKVVWLKIHGLDEETIHEQTGINASHQKDAVLALHRSPQHGLPLDKPFWREVATIMHNIRTACADSVSSVTQEVISSTYPTASQPSNDEPVILGNLTEREILRILDDKFKHHVASILDKGKMLKFIIWGQDRPRGWTNLMQCRDDPESLSTDNIKEALPQPLLDRCISCPVREICLAQALGRKPIFGRGGRRRRISNDDIEYYYAGYSPRERAELLVKADLDPSRIAQTVREALLARQESERRSARTAASRKPT